MILGQFQIEESPREIDACNIKDQTFAAFKLFSNDGLNAQKLSLCRIFNETFSSDRASRTTKTCALFKEKLMNKMIKFEIEDDRDVPY